MSPLCHFVGNETTAQSLNQRAALTRDSRSNLMTHWATRPAGISWQERRRACRLTPERATLLRNPVGGEDVSQTRASFISIIFGGWAFDRFYLGYHWTGFAKFLTFGGFGCWTIVDAVYVLIGHLQPSAGSVYNDFERVVEVFRENFNV